MQLFEIQARNGRFYVTPVAPYERGRYSIECATKAQAVQVVMREKTPLSAPEAFTACGQTAQGVPLFKPR